MGKKRISDKMRPRSNWVLRQGLVWSFVLVFAIWLGGSHLIYKELRENTAATSFPIESVRVNIYNVSQILNQLYQSEAYARAYMQTFDSSYIDAYNASLDSVSARFMEMRWREAGKDSADREFLRNIDTISMLLQRKHANMELLFSYVEELRKKPQEGISRIMVDSLSVEVPVQGPRVELERQQDTVVEVKTTRKPKMGFFKRLALAFKKQQVDTVYFVRQESRVVEKELSSRKEVRDSVRKAIARTVVQYENILRVSTHKVSERTDEILRLDAQLNQRFMQIMDDWQEAEVRSSLDSLQERAADVRKFSKTLAWMGVLSFTVIVFALFFLLREIVRSQRRSKALETSESEKAVLLASREQMLLSIAHDIKSPLSTITGSADIMGRMEMPAESQKYIAYTKYASSYLKDLVTNLLDYVKGQSGKLAPEATLFRPLALFNEIQAVYRLQAEEKGLSFKFSAQGRFLSEQDSLAQEWFRADALRIRQITGNLLSNAIKYTAAGVVFLRVDWTDTDLRIQVEDTGNGISEQDQPAVFKAFVRVGKGNAGVEGTGLGLPVTLKWVELLGGTMKMESSPGKGSLFEVFLPMERVDDAEVEKNVRKNRQKPADGTSRSLEGCRVAVIDDDIILKRILCDYLKRLGVDARPTFNPEELLAWVSESWPQIVITDLQMPSLSGYELLEKIKALDPDMPVLLLTGKHVEDLRAEFSDRAVNFSGFLKKPVDFDELVSVLLQARRSVGTPGPAGGASGSDAMPEGKPEDGGPELPGGDARKRYDLSDIRVLTGDSASDLQAFLDDFFDTAYDQIEDLKMYVEESRPDRLKALAHKMAALFGQLKMQDLYGRLRHWEAGTMPGMDELRAFEELLRQRERCIREEVSGQENRA